MHVEALNIFCEVVRHQSFSRGANASSVSQSAASQTVRQLENQLGIQLIDRSKRPWSLTAEGKIFFKGCQEIVERYHELQDAIRQRQEASGHTVRVASIYSIHLNDLTSYINKFQDVIPSANVEVAYMHPDQVHDQVLNDQYDLGLISFANPGRELTAIQWENQEMVVACLPTHQFVSHANTTDVNPGDLSGEAFITFDRGLPVRKEIDRFLRRHKAEVKVVAEFDNIENIKQAIEDGAGIAILPESTLRREVDSMTLVKLAFRLGADTPPLIRPLSILHRRGRRLNPAVMAFIDLLIAPAELAVAMSKLSSEPRKVGASA